MAKSRRKAGGPTRGRFKRKRMGKGWSTHRKLRMPPPKKTTVGGAEESAGTQ